MKKIFKVMIACGILMIGSEVRAEYKPNVGGIQIKPPTSTESSSNCTSSNYYIGFTQDSYRFQGLRISFYQGDKQIGNTIDVYTWGEAFYYAKGYEKVPDADASKNGFIKYVNTVNHSRYYYSKIDYQNNKEFELDGGNYYFYFDEVAYDKNKYTSYRVWDSSAKKYVYKTEVNGPLIYSTQDSTKPQLTAYLTTEDVMIRYLKLAKAEKLIKDANFIMTMEPVVSISSCVKGTYSGRYTATDLGYLLKNYKRIELNNNLKRFPGWLALVNGQTIGGIKFKKENNPNRTYIVEEMISNLGVGIGTISGSQIWTESPKTFKVIFHPIDLQNPFLNKDGTIRNLSDKSNWYGQQKTIDVDIYQKKPFVTVTLTPASIKSIREDNINYSNITEETYKKFKIKYNNIFR